MVSRPEEPSLLEKVVSPYPLFLGAALSFLFCCVAGRFLAGHNPFRHFERFHRYINLETGFYPTASQVHALGQATLDPNRIAVVIGGNSILYGSCQRREHLWTRHLQELLGDRYQVINLGIPSAEPPEFGAVAAEMLSRDRDRIILIADLGTSSGVQDPDGRHYRYFFWDAHDKGLLLNDREREQGLHHLAETRKDDNSFFELRRQARADSVLYFNDLWTTVAYRWYATVWHPFVRRSFTTPRKDYVDNEKPFTTPEQSYPPALEAENLARVRGLNRDAVPGLTANARVAFPEPLRARTLLLAVRDSPYYVQRLTPAEQATYSEFFPRCVQAFEAEGFAALEVGKGYSLDDYNDWFHFSERGGKRLAEEVAPKVRQLAEDLGYSH